MKLKHLISTSNDENLMIKLCYQTPSNKLGVIFHEAVKHSKFKLLKSLHSVFRVSPNVTIDASLNTPLILATKNKNYKMCQTLVDMGANVLAMNKWYETPLSLSKSESDTRIYSFLNRYRPYGSLRSGFENPKSKIDGNGSGNPILIECLQHEHESEALTVYNKAYFEYVAAHEKIAEWMQKIMDQDMKSPYEWYGSGLRPFTAFWVAKMNGKIVGTIAVVPRPENIQIAEILRFSVDPDFQRLGIGKELMYHVEKWCEFSGFHTIFLRTLSELSKAVRFYTNNGYSQVKSESKVTIDFMKKITPRHRIPLYDPRVLTPVKFHEANPEKGKIYMTHNYVKSRNIEDLIKEAINLRIPFPLKRDFTTFAVIQNYFDQMCQLNTKNYRKENWSLDYYIEETPGTLAVTSTGLSLLEKDLLTKPLIIPFNKAFGDIGTTLTDYFNEGARIECIYDKEGASVLDLYSRPEIQEKVMRKALSKYRELSDYSIRYGTFGIINGCNLFRPDLAKAIYDLFEPEKVLDMCAGWGDRILGAMACSTITEYYGFDPNTKLIPGYSNMISAFEGRVKGTYRIDSIPFENSELSNQYYDLAFTSPPFFDVEIYNSEASQSVSNNMTVESWLENWLFPMMEKAWKAVKFGGHLALYINDSKTQHLCQQMMKFSTTLEKNLFVGVIGVESQVAGKFRSLWVWEKMKLQ